MNDIISNLANVNLPSQPVLPSFEHILNLWDFKNAAMEVTSVINGILSRMPTFYLAFFAVSFLFIVLGLLFSIASKIM